MWFECVEIQPATLKNHEQKQMSWVCDHMHQQKNTLLDPNPLEPEPSWLFHLPSGFEFQRFGDVLKKMWDRIRYWEWEDCDLMDSWGTKKNEYPSMEHILLLMDFKSFFAWFENDTSKIDLNDTGGSWVCEETWLDFGRMPTDGRSLGKHWGFLEKIRGTVGKQLDRPRISPRCLEMISRISPHGHPNLN